MRIELQVLRDGRAYSRPQIHEFDVAKLDRNTLAIRLHTGWDPNYQINALLWITFAGENHPGWMGFRVQLAIDGLAVGVDRPGVVFMEETDTPSGLVHFPPVAAPGTSLGGWWTVTLRTVADA